MSSTPARSYDDGRKDERKAMGALGELGDLLKQQAQINQRLAQVQRELATDPNLVEALKALGFEQTGKGPITRGK